MYHIKVKSLHSDTMKDHAPHGHGFSLKIAMPYLDEELPGEGREVGVVGSVGGDVAGGAAETLHHGMRGGKQGPIHFSPQQPRVQASATQGDL